MFLKRLRQCPLLHSNPLHSTLLHSATLSLETLQNKYFWALWFEKSLYFVCVCDDVRGHYQQTYCQVTFLTPLLKGAAEKPISFASLPWHQNVTKQGMFSSFGSKMFIFVLFPTCLSASLPYLDTKTLQNKACFPQLTQKGLYLKRFRTTLKLQAHKTLTPVTFPRYFDVISSSDS